MNRKAQMPGEQAGHFKTLINDPWRICFVWHDDGANQVEIVDYH